MKTGREFTVTVGSAEYKIERAPDGRLFLDDKPVDYSIEPVEQGVYMLRIGALHFDVTHQAADPGETERLMYINGKKIGVTIEDERSALMSRFEASKATLLHTAAVKAPMPGRIVRILVSEGELIEQGQGLVILEAMKMENEIKSPVAGIVKTVRIAEKDAVEKNTVLIELA